MKLSKSTYFRVGLLIVADWLAGCQFGGSLPVQDSVDVKREQAKGQWPAELPNVMFVTDFELKAERIKLRDDIRGVLSNQPIQDDSQTSSQSVPLTDDAPEERARSIVNAMSENLVDQLRKRGFTVQRLPVSGAVLPFDGWLLQGVFTEKDDSNRIKRAVIGTNKGASSMDAQIAISDLADSDPKKPFIVFGSVKNLKKTSGAVPQVAATRFVLEKRAKTQDILKITSQIADEIVKNADKFKGKNGRTK